MATTSTPGWTCTGEPHSCGKMLCGPGKAIYPRCQIFQEVLDEIASTQIPEYTLWYETPSTAVAHRTASVTTTPYARPRNLIANMTLIDVSEDPTVPCRPYVAVSYTWDQTPEFVCWQGRRVTTQALSIAERLAAHTSHALWIDAICIPQDDEEVKQQELPKMADIYRGAQVVVCLVDGVGPEACEAVQQGVRVMQMVPYRDLDAAGDIYGCYLFAIGDRNDAFCCIFEHRWWERAWTFQEAVLNPQTYLVGDSDHTIPISDVLKIVAVVSRWVACVPALHDTRSETLGRPRAFWDSVSAMTDAAERPLSLSEAIACAWRRDAKERHDLVYSLVGVCGLSRLIQPRYQAPFEAVLLELFQAAVSIGDHTWLTWSGTTARTACDSFKAGMGLIPDVDTVRRTAFTGITSWRSTMLPSAVRPADGAGAGVSIPYRSTGVIRTISPPQSLPNMVAHLCESGYSHDEVWDLLFGLRVGLMDDITRAVGQDGIAQPALNLAVLLVSDRRVYVDGRTMTDMAGDFPWMSDGGITFTNYSIMAADSWLQILGSPDLVLVSTQGGTVVVPSDCGVLSGGGRIYVLPVEPPPPASTFLANKERGSRGLAFVTNGAGPFNVCATAVVITKTNAGSGKWQRRVIG